MINQIFEREQIEKDICTILNDFDKNHKNVNFKKGFYIYGSSGVGKTTFIKEILKKLNYDVIHYDAGDVRNKALIDNIASNNIASNNVLDMMHHRVKKIVIVMDEIDGMNSGDKGGLTALIKLIRQKKTKKQKLENTTLNPIICIGNYNMDKKIKELVKVCNVFELKTPTPDQMKRWIQTMFPKIDVAQIDVISNYANGDLRKLGLIQKLYDNKSDLIRPQILQNILNVKTFNEDTNKITKSLIARPYKMEDHNVLMNETDRTTVALLWHENIVDVIPQNPSNSLPFYLRFLDNICYSDYIDRITFQNQIWHFNEMSSLMKTFNNNRIYHLSNKATSAQSIDIRFTKVLTKYSTEYNNIEFIYDLCQKMDLDKKDLISFFHDMRIFFKERNQDVVNDTNVINSLESIFESYDINKLDIKRMYRYLDRNVKKDVTIDELDDE
jgi:DNA polymerase III delta prime subunit